MSEELFSEQNWKSNEIINNYIQDSLLAEYKVNNSIEIVFEDISKPYFNYSTKKENWADFSRNFNKTEELYDFVYMRHTLEKMGNPGDILEFLRNYSVSGFIETTSPLVEFSRRIQKEHLKYRGHVLSRYIIWVEPELDILHILPKYPLIEYLTVPEETEQNLRNILQKQPHYWNTYFVWNSDKPIYYKLYEHGINFDIKNDYHNLIKKSIDDSVKSTNKFLSHINKKINIFKDNINDYISKSPEA